MFALFYSAQRFVLWPFGAQVGGAWTLPEARKMPMKRAESYLSVARRVGRLLQDQDEATLVSYFCRPLVIRFCLQLCIRLRLFFGALDCFDNQFIQYRHIHII